MIPDYSRSIIYWCSSADPLVDTQRTSASQRAGRISPPYLQIFYPSLTFGQLDLSSTRVLSVTLRYWPVSATSLINDSDISLSHLSSPTALQDLSCTSPSYGLSLLHSVIRVYCSPSAASTPSESSSGHCPAPTPYSDFRLPQQTFCHFALFAIVQNSWTVTKEQVSEVRLHFYPEEYLASFSILGPSTKHKLLYGRVTSLNLIGTLAPKLRTRSLYLA
jgi:hypothetical protein